LRGPKLIWVPSKSGWMCVGTIGIGSLIHLDSYWLSYVESSIKVKCIFYSNAKSRWVNSKCYNIQVSYQVMDDLLELFDGLQIFDLKLPNWMIVS
jgi:hypothetical protein